MQSFSFKGLMCPVFTPFNDDKERSVNYDAIDKYAAYLKQKDMNGVMVNGMTGEGMTLSVDERKRLAEVWFKVAQKLQLTMLLNIGGACVADVYEMAAHAESLGVDAIMVLPDLFFRPVVEEDLLYYVRDVAKYAPSIPILYYHIPFMTGLYLKMWRFYELAEKEIPNFGGIYYADANLDCAVETWMANRNVIVAMGTTMLGAMSMGFNAISMTVMNIIPECMVELYENVLNGRWKEAMAIQANIVKYVRNIWAYDEDLIVKMKMEFNKINSGLNMGPTRKPMFSEMMMPRM